MTGNCIVVRDLKPPTFDKRGYSRFARVRKGSLNNPAIFTFQDLLHLLAGHCRVVRQHPHHERKSLCLYLLWSQGPLGTLPQEFLYFSGLWVAIAGESLAEFTLVEVGHLSTPLPRISSMLHRRCLPPGLYTIAYTHDSTTALPTDCRNQAAIKYG